MRIPFNEMKETFRSILEHHSFPDKKATLCAEIFTSNSCDGIYSHGLNRFPVFLDYVKEGLVDPSAEPEKIGGTDVIEQWDGHLGPGVYNATLAMQRACAIADKFGIGAVALKNTNHWMRGGSYGWQALQQQKAALCMTNTIANMPPWGGTEPGIGNNPLVIAVPYNNKPMVLDMAMSQYSYGKLQEYELKDQQLPYDGGYDTEGRLTKDPKAIRLSKRILPAGLWKGSGLSIAIDFLVSFLSGGKTTAMISATGKEYGLSQFFLCIKNNEPNAEALKQAIDAIQSDPSGKTRYPGENTWQTRQLNLKEGIPVNEEIWKKIKSLDGSRL